MLYIKGRCARDSFDPGALLYRFQGAHWDILGSVPWDSEFFTRPLAQPNLMVFAFTVEVAVVLFEQPLY